MAIKRGIDIKLNIKPIFGTLVHDYVFEGPCRFGTGEMLTAAYDRAASGESFKAFKSNLNKYLSGIDFNVLEPFYFERNEEFLISSSLIDAMTEDDSNADCYLIGSAGRIYDDILALAEATHKPIFTVQFCCNNTMVIAMLRARGLEGYGYTTWEQTARHLRIMRVKKVFKETNVLLITRGNSNMAAISSADGFISLEQVTKDIGPHFRYLDLHEFLDFLTPGSDANHTLPTRNGHNLDEKDLEQINKMVDDLTAGAEECAIDKKYVVNSLKGYWLARKMLDYMDCSAMTLPCPESCATTRLNKEQVTFCLNHSLMNENGIPSACEYDIPGLLAMLLLSNLTRSAPYLGNTVSVTLQPDNMTPVFNMIPYNGVDKIIPTIADEETRRNLIITFHSVQNRKMKGFNKPNDTYRLSPFTGSGWGTTMRHNFDCEKGQVITLARFSPDGKRLFVAKGWIVSAVGYNLSGCTAGVLFKVRDREDFYTKQCDFGNHMPLVYGDCVDDVVEWAKLMGLEAVVAQ